jgi:TPR repeat protein
MRLKIIVSTIVVILLAVVITPSFITGTHPVSSAATSLATPATFATSQAGELTKPSIKYPALNTADRHKLDFAQQAFKRQNYDVAFAEFNKIIAISPPAQFFVAKMYEQGLGVAQNTRRAIRWYASAAEQGSIDAMKALATLFSSGERLGKNYKEAFHWFYQAAMAGDAASQGRVALMLNKGQGVAADMTSAAAWLDISCGEKTADICTLSASFLLTPEQLKQSQLLTIKYQNMIQQSKKSSFYTRIKS